MICPLRIGEESASPIAPHRLSGEGKQWRRKLRHREAGLNPGNDEHNISNRKANKILTLRAKIEMINMKKGN